MTIPRFHLFELEDFAWCPNIIRDLATDYLQFMETKMKLHRPVVPLLAFHHFNPDDGRAVLRSAVVARQPIGVFEIPERTIPIIIATALIVPILVLVVTPFIRPFRWSRLLFTYPLPLVPLTCLWDGFVSQLRAYTPDELKNLATSLGDVGYQWNAGKVRLQGSAAHLTYLIGRSTRSD